MLYELLSRVQITFTVGFHILWPAFTVGLCMFLFICECLYLKTKNNAYTSIYMFWSKIFALSFAMGVATSIPVVFQIGTNFAKFSEFASPILGPLLSMEVLTTFFLQTVFIGVMLFGWKKVHPVLHLVATGLVMLGTHNSVLCISIINSWLHTPSGYKVANGVISATSWREVVFNPSMPYRVTYALLSSYIATLLVILGVSALYLKQQSQKILAKKTFSISFTLLTFLLPLQMITGSLHTINTFKTQPIKIAAIQGQWKTNAGSPFTLFSVVNSKEEKNSFEVKIPYFTSLLLTQSIDGEVKGLKDWPKEERPSVGIAFWCFRITLVVKTAMLGFLLWGIVLNFKKQLYNNKKYLTSAPYIIPAGFIIIITEWITSEAIKHPWAIYGILKTSDSYSHINTPAIIFSLSFFVFLYCSLLCFFIHFTRNLFKRGMIPSDGISVYNN